MRFRGLYRIFVTVVVLLFGCYTLRAECRVADNAMEVAPSQHYGYSSWADFSEYFNLAYVRHDRGGLKSFNSSQLSAGKPRFVSDLLDRSEYYGAIVGTNVWVRRQPVISQTTQMFKVNTGDRVLVLRSSFYNGGRLWCYVRIVSGPHSYSEGYICSDYVVVQREYDVLSRFVIGRSPNIGIANKSRELCAVANLLLYMCADERYDNLTVSKGQTFKFGSTSLVAYRIYNSSVSYNNSILAVVLFDGDRNDYLVLGVVPGTTFDMAMRNYDGSYEIYYY
ncbi:MAG: hypothetical protein IJE99_03400 [Alistipes sp.]|nr:hypothetical protein [Alistipes sp.]